MKASTNIQLKKRYAYNIDNFVGVDYTSERSKVAKTRAVKAENFYYDDGALKKRNGWLEALNLVESQIGCLFYDDYNDRLIVWGSTDDGLPIAINNFSNCKNVVDFVNAKETLGLETTTGLEAYNRRAQVFCNKKKAYIIGFGNIYVYDADDRQYIRSVDYNSIVFGEPPKYVYIPTTTISISEYSVTDTRESFEQINRLTPFKKNTLVGKAYVQVENVYQVLTYDLDAVIDVSKRVIITLKIGEELKTISNGETSGTYDKLYIGSTQVGSITDNAIHLIPENLIANGITSIAPTISGEANIEVCFAEKRERFTYETDGCTITLSNLENNSIYYNGGKFEFQFKHSSSSDPAGAKWYIKDQGSWKEISYSYDISTGYTPSYEKTISGTTIYEPYGFRTDPPGDALVTIYADVAIDQTIKQCTFGCLYGAEGLTDTLFLSGNSNLPNNDFWSGKDKFGNPDFTYFPVLNVDAVGDDGGAISGYMRASDGTLCIFKDVSFGSPSIYFRNCEAKTMTDENGNLTDIQYLYKKVASGFTDRVRSNFTTAYFNNEGLVLSDRGVVAVKTLQNRNSNEKALYNRSYFINKKLASFDINKAAAVVYKGKYYLSVGGSCFVADENLMSDGNYEWAEFTNIDAFVWCVAAGRLVFGTEDGRVCMFDEQFSDRTYKSLETEGALALDSEDDTKIIIADPYQDYVKEGDVIYMTVTNLYAKMMDVTVANGRIYPDENNTIYKYPTTGQEVYPVYSDGNDTKIGDKCYIDDIVFYDDSFRILDKNGIDKTTAAHTGYTLVALALQMSGKKFIVHSKDVDDNEVTTFTLRLPYITLDYESDPPEDTSDNALRFVRDTTEDSPVIINAIVEKVSPVVAKWFSPPLEIGSFDSLKTLLRLDISAEQTKYSKMKIGVVTKDYACETLMKGLNVYDLTNTDFKEFSLEQGFKTSYSFKTHAKYNYIVFYFTSEGDGNCVVDKLIAVYKYDGINKGVQ